MGRTGQRSGGRARTGQRRGSRARTGRAARAAVAACVLAVLLGAIDAPLVAQSREQVALEQARREVARVKAELEAAERFQAQADVDLQQADEQLARVEAAVNEAAVAYERQELAVEKAARQFAELEAHAEALEAQIAGLAVRLYKRGASADVDVVLRAGSIADALARSGYVRAVAAADRLSLERVAATRIAVDAQRVRLEEELGRLAELRVERELLHAEVAEVRAHRALVAAEARSRVEGLHHESGQLEAESRRLTQLIQEQQARERARVAAQAAAAQAAAAQAAAAQAAAVRAAANATVAAQVSARGYVWPRCDRVSSEYGRRWGRMHQGIDIAGRSGAPIVAAKAGVVLFTGSQGGYGRLVLVDHGDGVVTAYAHLSRFRVSSGQRVAAGQLIGDVGATGNATGPHLHFETRVNGQPVNPRQLLPRGC